MTEYCPKCFSKIGEWIDDPVLTPEGLSGEEYKGITIPNASHIEELQNYYGALEINISSEYITEWAIIENQNFRHFHIEQLRISIENILAELNLTLIDYFKYDKYGNETGSTQTEWTDVNRINKEDLLEEGDEGYIDYGYIAGATVPLLIKPINIRAIHIEELRIGLYNVLEWVEDWLVQKEHPLFYKKQPVPNQPQVPFIEIPAPWASFSISGDSKYNLTVKRTGDRGEWTSFSKGGYWTTPALQTHSIEMSQNQVNFSANGYENYPAGGYISAAQSAYFDETSIGGIYTYPDTPELGRLYDKLPVIYLRNGSTWQNVLVKIYQSFNGSFSAEVAVPNPADWWVHFNRVSSYGHWIFQVRFEYLAWGISGVPREVRAEINTFVTGTKPTIYQTSGSINIGYQELNCLPIIKAIQDARGTKYSKSPYIKLRNIRIMGSVDARTVFVSGSPVTANWAQISANMEINKIEVITSPYEEE